MVNPKEQKGPVNNPSTQKDIEPQQNVLASLKTWLTEHAISNEQAEFATASIGNFYNNTIPSFCEPPHRLGISTIIDEFYRAHVFLILSQTSMRPSTVQYPRNQFHKVFMQEVSRKRKLDFSIHLEYLKGFDKQQDPPAASEEPFDDRPMYLGETNIGILTETIPPTKTS